MSKIASKLRRHGKDSWQFCVSQGTTVTTDPVTGERRRKPVVRWFTIRATTRKEAEAKQAEILDQLAKGTYVEPSKKTLAEFLREDFLPHVVAKGRSPKTVTSYRSTIEGHIIPHLGDLRLDQIAPIHVERWLNTVTTRPRARDANGKPKDPPRRPSNRSLQYWRMILRRALQYAVEMELLPRNPVDRVKPPKVVYGRPDAYSREEVERILAICPRYRIGALVTAALYTGARLGELLALRWSDVDLATGVITFRRTLVDAGSQKDDRDPLFKETTKDDDIRDVPIAPELADALAAWRKRWIEERAKADGGYFDRFHLVFPTATGWPMSHRNAQRDSAALFKAAGVRRLSPHKLRHTFATRLLDAGVDVDTVAELLGDDLQVVKQHYLGARPEAKKAAVQALGRYLCSGSPPPGATATGADASPGAAPAS